VQDEDIFLKTQHYDKLFGEYNTCAARADAILLSKEHNIYYIVARTGIMPYNGGCINRVVFSPSIHY
jgi:hypothetical protein